MVVELNTWPGFSPVEGKLGWFGEGPGTHPGSTGR
jgi:hypothetical protein